MNIRLSAAAAVGVLLAAGGLSHLSARSQTRAGVTPADYLRWRTELRNWGRWGPNDQKGTANLTTPPKGHEAVKLARSGIVVSLAHPVPQALAGDVPASAIFHPPTNGITDTNTTDTY